MNKPLLFIATLSLGVTAAAAQAPIERRAPQPPLPFINRWPVPGAVAPRTKLLVSLGSGYGDTHFCRLRNITADTLECEGRHHGTVTYLRSEIESLAAVQTHVSPSLFFMGAAATALVVGLCIDSGGLFLLGLIIGGVTGAAQDDRLFGSPQPPHPPAGRLIYVAPAS